MILTVWKSVTEEEQKELQLITGRLPKKENVRKNLENNRSNQIKEGDLVSPLQGLHRLDGVGKLLEKDRLLEKTGERVENQNELAVEQEEKVGVRTEVLLKLEESLEKEPPDRRQRFCRFYLSLFFTQKFALFICFPIFLIDLVLQKREREDRD